MMSNSLWQRGNTNEGRKKKTEKKQGCLGKKTIRTDSSKVKPHKLWSRLLLTNTEHTEKYNWIPVFLMLSVPPSFSPSSSRITSSSSWPLLLPCWSSSVEPYSFSWSSSSTVCKSVLTPIVITVFNAKWNVRQQKQEAFRKNYHGCQSHRFSKFPYFPTINNEKNVPER